MTPTLRLTFAPPDEAGIIALSWYLDGHSAVTTDLQSPFAHQHWDLVMRALNARQFPDYDRYPGARFAHSTQEQASLQQYGLWDTPHQQLPTDLHARVGRALGTALLNDERSRALLQRLREADGTVVLAFVPDQANSQHIGVMPWELAFEGVQPWLLRSGSVLPCVRLFTAAPPVLALPNPPRILVLAPQAGFNDGARRYEREARRYLRDALGDRVEIEQLGPPITMDMLDDRLREDPAVTLVDYYGHGLLQNHQGHLMLDDGAGGHDLVSAARLQALPNMPPFWIISACQSAQQPSGEELVASLAPALVAHPRVAAVLAMQLTTRMAVATDYIVPAIYETLAQQESLQEAAAEARRRLYAAEKDSASFYLPTLYVRQQHPEPLYLLTPARRLHPSVQGAAPLPTSGNPFTPGRIAPPDRFVGRRRELAEILARLENMLSVSLVGEARIGKSSLLQYLEANLAERLRERGTYLPIYLSMDSQGSQANFCKALLERLLPHMPPVPGQERALRTLEQKADPSLEETTRALEWAAQSGLRVVLLLDEFKDLLERPQEFNEVFRGRLRSLYINSQVALVMATRQSLTDIEGLDAYFVNGVDQQFLPTLHPDEAEALLRLPHDRLFTDAEVRIGLEVGRNHPLRLQWAGFLIYQSKGQPPGMLHAEDSSLREQAHRTLSRTVQEKYDWAMKASSSQLGQQPRSRLSMLDTVNHAITRLAELLDNLGGRITVVLLLLGLAALLLYAFGILSLEQVQEWQRLLSGGA
jgi:hypothetical protein